MDLRYNVKIMLQSIVNMLNYFYRKKCNPCTLFLTKICLYFMSIHIQKKIRAGGKKGMKIIKMSLMADEGQKDSQRVSCSRTRMVMSSTELLLIKYTKSESICRHSLACIYPCLALIFVKVQLMKFQQLHLLCELRYFVLQVYILHEL